MPAPSAQCIADRPFWAGVHKAATEYALGVFHPLLPDHIVHIQPHRAACRAPFAVGAEAPISRESERWPADEIPDLPCDDHDHRDRAEIMTEAASPGRYGEYGDNYYFDVLENQSFYAPKEWCKIITEDE